MDRIAGHPTVILAYEAAREAVQRFADEYDRLRPLRDPVAHAMKIRAAMNSAATPEELVKLGNDLAAIENSGTETVRVNAWVMVRRALMAALPAVNALWPVVEHAVDELRNSVETAETALYAQYGLPRHPTTLSRACVDLAGLAAESRNAIKLMIDQMTATFTPRPNNLRAIIDRFSR